ncbi:MAG: hypothetical protein KDK23_00760 [Leptospiraceae bacterium]|nr:hypothetical protein [Leptospiraceae bacterium]
MASTGSKLLRQSVALLLIGSYVSCSTFQAMESLQGPEVNELPVTTRKLRILPVEFKNSANMDKVNFISNSQHDTLIHTVDREQAVPGQSTNNSSEDGAGKESTGIIVAKAKGVDLKSYKPGESDSSETDQSAAQESDEEGSSSDQSLKSLIGDKLFIPATAANPETGESPEPAPYRVPMVDADSVPSMDGGEILKEVLVSNMVQTNRFEVLSPAAFSTEGEAGIPQKEELKEKQVDYLLFAEITDFEVKQDVQYWKVPLWALLLIAAFLVKDDDTRAFILNTLVRLWLYLPSDSKFWELGLGTEDLELRISASVNLRLVDPYTGSVVYADQQSLDRVETVGNMDLIVWRSENSLQIKESTAGRQLRFLTANMVNELVRRMTPASALPENASDSTQNNTSESP